VSGRDHGRWLRARAAATPGAGAGLRWWEEPIRGKRRRTVAAVVSTGNGNGVVRGWWQMGSSDVEVRNTGGMWLEEATASTSGGGWISDCMGMWEAREVRLRWRAEARGDGGRWRCGMGGGLREGRRERRREEPRGWRRRRRGAWGRRRWIGGGGRG
jgi:hypothetical protein